MKILVMDETAEVFSLECESTDTIAHLQVKLDKITGIRFFYQSLMFDGKLLGDKLSENTTLADVGVQDGSLTLIRFTFQLMPLCGSSGVIERPQSPPRIPENDYLYYADAFKSGWREEHAKALLHLLLELCQDGTISEGNVTDEAWLRIQNSLNNSMKCSFQIDFLKERLRDYMQLYSVLTDQTSTSIFNWDRERKIITIESDWKKKYPVLLLLCGPHIPYFDTLEEVCLLVNTTRSSEHRVSETLTNINNAREAHSSSGEICIRRPSNLSLMCSSTLSGKENGYLRSTIKILVVDEIAKVFSLECESTDTIAHLKEKLDNITGDLMFDGKLLGDDFSEKMTLADVGIQDGSLILKSSVDLSSDDLIKWPSGWPPSPRRIPENDYLYYADAFKSGWREEHAKSLLHLLLELCQDGTISEGNVTDEARLRIQNNLKNSMECSFQIDFLKERLRDYKQLYAILSETGSSMFLWHYDSKTITSKSNWREREIS